MTRRVSFTLAFAITAIFFAFVFVMAFRPSVLTGFRGLTYSLGFILLILVAMGGYSWWRISRIDE
jgi:hypothetical protein